MFFRAHFVQKGSQPSVIKCLRYSSDSNFKPRWPRMFINKRSSTIMSEFMQIPSQVRALPTTGRNNCNNKSLWKIWIYRLAGLAAFLDPKSSMIYRRIQLSILSLCRHSKSSRCVLWRHRRKNIADFYGLPNDKLSSCDYHGGSNRHWSYLNAQRPRQHFWKVLGDSVGRWPTMTVIG